MASGEGASTVPVPEVVSLVVKNPSNHAVDFLMEVPAGGTVLSVKRRLQRDYVGNPDPSAQKLIISGHIVRDEQVIREILSKANLSEPQVVHLVVSSGLQGPGPRPPSASLLTPSSQPPASMVTPPRPQSTRDAPAGASTPASMHSSSGITQSHSSRPAAPPPPNSRPETPARHETTPPQTSIPPSRVPITSSPIPSSQDSPNRPHAVHPPSSFELPSRVPPLQTPSASGKARDEAGPSSQSAGPSTSGAGEASGRDSQPPAAQGAGANGPQGLSNEALHALYLQTLLGNPLLGPMALNPALLHPALLGMPPMLPPMFPGLPPGMPYPLQGYMPGPQQMRPPQPGVYAMPPGMPYPYAGYPYGLPYHPPMPNPAGSFPPQAAPSAPQQPPQSGLRQRGTPGPAQPPAAGAGAVGGAAVGGAAQQGQAARQRRVQIDFLLLLKLAVVVFVFNQDGSLERLLFLSFAATLIYLYQTGTLAPFLQRMARRAQNGAARQPQGARAPAPPPGPQPAGQAPAGPPEGVPLARGDHFMPVPQRGGQWQLLREVQTFVLGFLTSLLPGWQAPDELQPPRPQAPPQENNQEAGGPDRPHQD